MAQVSSTMHAYYRSLFPLLLRDDALATGKSHHHHYVPVINIPRQDFALRTGNHPIPILHPGVLERRSSLPPSTV
jgi:hypothetical protein